VNILRKNTAPRYRRKEGITSYLLASARTCGAGHLTTTLVDIEPGGQQRIHSHAPEQIYFILEGLGIMTVGDETEEVQQGDCVFVPSGSPHGIRNQTTHILRYLSAAAPAFTDGELVSFWPLQSEAEEGDRK
jgi:mannose-6-phosphate isomerase-like protein (cupin superfamily)